MAKARTRKRRRRAKAGSGFIMGEVISMQYVHEEDGQLYVHEFDPGVRVLAMEDGSLRIYKPGSTVWSDL